MSVHATGTPNAIDALVGTTLADADADEATADSTTDNRTTDNSTKNTAAAGAAGLERSEVVETPAGAIRYRLRGQGPPMVLVSTLAGTWMRQVPVLRQRFTLLTYDMRGFGESPSTAGFPSNAEHADDLALVLDTLGIDRATVVGLSHGGLVSQLFAARHPQRLSGLALVSTFASRLEATPLFLRMLYGFLERDDLANFWEVLKSFLFSADNWGLLERREAALRRAMFDQYTTASLRSIYGGALEHECPPGLAAAPCPVLVVGGEHDKLFPPAVTRDLAARVPGSTLLMLPAAHVPPVEVPRAFNEAVAQFFGGAS